MVYVLLVAHCFVSLREWEVWFSSAINFHPVWLVSWIPQEFAAKAWLVTTAAALVFCAANAWGTNRWLRSIATLFLVLHFSIEDSRDAIRHGEHALLWISLILAFLPGEFTSERQTQVRYQRVFRLAQSMLLLFYGMAGVVKVATSIVQSLRGDRALLDADAGALVISEWLLQGDETSLLGSWMVHHPAFASIGLLLSVVLELACLVAIFWTRIHALTGVSLILMHVAIGLAMNVWFPENVALIAVILVLASRPVVLEPSGRSRGIQ